MPESKKDYLYSIAKNIYGSYSVPKSSDYTLDDIFYLNSSSRNEFVLNIDRGPSIIEINPWS